MADRDFVIDVSRTCLQQRFFSTFSFESREKLFAALRDMSVGVDSLAQSADSKESVYSGWVYWFLFIKGYLQYEAGGAVGDDNTYFDYLLRYYGPRGHDPGIAQEMSVPETARARVIRRFELAACARDAPVDQPWEIDPVLVIVTEELPVHPLRIYPAGAQEPLEAALVDGWHRLFVARLWGVGSVPGRVSQHREAAAA